MRKHFIDNIRWAVVLTVIVYHVFYMFNASGVLGGIGSFSDVQYQDVYMYFVYPWFMVLLYLIAGISAKYALDLQGGKTFIKKRTWKLLVPSTLGLFVLHWIVGIFYIWIGGAIEQIPKFILYPIAVLSGSGPLWFIHLLWLYSLLIVLIRKIKGCDRFYEMCGKCNTVVILLLAVLVWGSAQILNMPVITTYRFGIYFMAFLIGYFVLSHDSVQDKIEKIWLPMIIVSVVMGIAYVVYYFGQNYTDDNVLRSLFTNVYAWFMSIAIIGTAKKWFNDTGKFRGYMTRSSFGFYVLHYEWVLLPCYFMKEKTALPVWSIYVLGIVIAAAGAAGFYEVVRRIPGVRCLVLGIKKDRRTV